MQPSRRPNKCPQHNSTTWKTNEDDRIDAIANGNLAAQKEEVIFQALPSKEVGQVLDWDTSSISNEDEVIESWDEDSSSSSTAATSGSPLSNFGVAPLLPTRSSLRPKIVMSTSQLVELHQFDNVSTSTASQSTGTEASRPFTSEQIPLNSNDLLVDSKPVVKGLGTDDRLSIKFRTPRSSTLTVASLRKRLSNATDKYSHSSLEDIVSIMEHCTISTSSSILVAPSRLSTPPLTYLPAVEKDAKLVHKPERPVILPGAFPEYCWEQIISNKLIPCDRGQKYRKAKICGHIGRKPNRSTNYRSAQYKAYTGPGGEKVDIFGNSALHIAAALATPPDTLIDLFGSNASIHTLNSAGETFLHLIHPECYDFHGLGNDICSLLKELQGRGFNFLQQDHNGRNSLHWLAQPKLSAIARRKISRAVLDLRIPISMSRDNLGYSVESTVREQMKFENFIGLDPEIVLHPPQDSLSQKQELVKDRYVRNFKNNSFIQTVEDLQRYTYHADLLKTILASRRNPRFEDSNGRNGLHCLAEVSFNLPMPMSQSSQITSHVENNNAAQLLENLDYLLEAGVDPNSHDKEGVTPFMAFIVHRRRGEDDDSITRSLHRLFKSGADIHRRNRQGETSLHLAVKLGRRAATKFLLSVGANVHARDANGLGIVALGHKSADEAKKTEFLYAQIMLCVALATNAGAVSAPTILGEWGMRSPVVNNPPDGDHFIPESIAIHLSGWESE